MLRRKDFEKMILVPGVINFATDITEQAHIFEEWYNLPHGPQSLNYSEVDSFTMNGLPKDDPEHPIKVTIDVATIVVDAIEYYAYTLYTTTERYKEKFPKTYYVEKVTPVERVVQKIKKQREFLCNLRNKVLDEIELTKGEERQSLLQRYHRLLGQEMGFDIAIEIAETGQNTPVVKNNHQSSLQKRFTDIVNGDVRPNYEGELKDIERTLREFNECHGLDE